MDSFKCPKCNHDYEIADLDLRAAVKLRQQPKIEPIKVLVCEDDVYIRDLVSSALNSIDNIMVLGMNERSTFEIQNFQRSWLENKPTNQTNERPHGWYQQFEKRNNRKNFR